MSKWNDWKKNVGDSRPWHLLDPNKIVKDSEIAKNRLEICISCPRLVSITKQCLECGCFMSAKVHLSNAECPLNKWGKSE